MITWSIKLCSHMWHYVLSRIWRNLLRDIEIVRNRRSEKLLKLGGGQKIFIFRGACPMREGIIFQGKVHNSLHTMYDELFFVVWLTNERRSALFPAWTIVKDSPPSEVSDMPRVGFKPAQNLSWGFSEWSCSELITTTPRRQKMLPVLVTVDESWDL